MSQGTARRSQSTIAFSNNADANESIIFQQQKRTKANEDSTPQLVINNEPHHQPTNSAGRTAVTNSGNNISNNEDIDIIKLERLYDKRDRYQSHISFLKDCIAIKRIPNGLIINLEPTIGNHDEEFRSNWYQQLEKFSLKLMKDIVEFSEKTSNETTAKITMEQEKLGTTKLNTDVTNTLKINSDNRKRILHNSKR